MRNSIVVLLVSLLSFSFAAYANTASGTVIDSQGTAVTISYDVGGQTRSANSAVTASVTVADHGGINLQAQTWTSPADNTIVAGLGSSYTYSISNSGNLTETVNGSLGNLAGGFTGAWLSSISSSSVTISREGIVAGLSLLVTADATASDGDTGSLDLTLSGTAGSVYGQYNGSNGYTYGATQNVIEPISFIVSAPNISITKNVSIQAPATYVALGGAATDPVPGAILTYTLEYYNYGSYQGTNVEVTDLVPSDTEFASASGGTSIEYDHGTGWDAVYVPSAPVDPDVSAVKWVLGTVAADSGGTVTLNVIVQ